jgi:hypothetical protein
MNHFSVYKELGVITMCIYLQRLNAFCVCTEKIDEGVRDDY